MNSLQKELELNIEGEVRFDSISKRVYSVDASIYEIEPIGIVLPKTKKDLIEAVKIAHKHNIPITARGAATGITGGCIGKSLIIDTSKYLHRILEINICDGYAICEPGVVQNQLNEALDPLGFRLGPETSTGNRATIGGMVGNNSAGTRSLRFGKMVDHILETELLLADGTLLQFDEIDATEWATKCLLEGAEGEIYRAIRKIKENDAEEIEKRIPDIPRRVNGYNLDVLLKKESLNVSQLITGSEGTFGIVTKIKMRIVPKQKATAVCLLHFETMMQGMRSVERILNFDPSAVEMMDDRILEAGRSSPSMRGKLGWIVGNPKIIFAVEFDGETAEEVKNKAQRFEVDMQNERIGYARSCLMDPSEIAHIWDVRKSGLGLLLSKRSYSRAIAFIEDVSVAPKELPEFMEKFEQYLASVNKEAGMYGHVGSGCLHLRPYVDLRNPDELKLMRKIMLDVANIVLEHHGALSGEHGDGLLRSWLIEKMYGKQINEAFLSLKAAFDPENRMNPGKIVNAPELEENLRIDPNVKQEEIETFLDFSREGGFALAADLCNGNGLCRKKEEVMCPPFQATGDEYHTTRARAQALRAVINGRMPLEELTSDGMYDVMDLCVECKGCKTECPSQVDMAKMKSEFLYQYQEKRGYSLRNRIFGNIGAWNRILLPIAPIVNPIAESRIGKSILSLFGISEHRSLPLLAYDIFSHWYEENVEHDENRKHVVLFNDTFTEFNTPEIGKAAVKVLDAMDYDVIVPEWQCCGRPFISKGMLKQARNQAEKVLTTLLPFAIANIPIVGLEPSCILTIIDDHPDLLPGLQNQVEKLVEQCCTFDEFMEEHLINGKLPLKIDEQERRILLHGHCHQKSLVGTGPTMQVLQAIPGAEVEEIPSGCCGMAGSFGYESEHYDISMKIGELQLFPAVRDAEPTAYLVADGTSCRTQIKDGTGRKALHLAELLAELIE